jgi:hypothetical protein
MGFPHLQLGYYSLRDERTYNTDPGTIQTLASHSLGGQRAKPLNNAIVLPK